MAKKAEVKFFCENCGSEVPLNAKLCPKCGRSFSSVRCPACGFVGEEGLFGKGCPACGYRVDGNGSNGWERYIPTAAQHGLPLWVYVVTAMALAAAAVGLYFSIIQ
jgi:predicted RNA-binding Zn-ribbon protein involved in translation (DUF1610 family)